MSYIRIPESNTTRNENELRATVDALTTAYLRLKAVADKQAQIHAESGAAGIAAEYNLTSEADAADVHSLVGSATTELEGAPFFQQLISRLG